MFSPGTVKDVKEMADKSFLKKAINLNVKSSRFTMKKKKKKVTYLNDHGISRRSYRDPQDIL